MEILCIYIYYIVDFYNIDVYVLTRNFVETELFELSSEKERNAQSNQNFICPLFIR